MAGRSAPSISLILEPFRMCKQVKGKRKIAVYGHNLMIEVIGASLRENPEFEVQKIEGPFPGIIEALGEHPPEVILFDLTALQLQFAIPLLRTQPSIMLIGVDLRNNKMLVLSCRQSPFFTAEDLLRAIGEKILQK
jgi:hypothetical protein